MPTPRILRRPEVEAKTGMSRSTIYKQIKDGNFPKPVPIAGRAVGWSSDAIDNWIRERIEAAVIQEGL